MTEVVRVAVVNDLEVIVAGVAALLATHPEIEVKDRIVVGEPIEEPVDLALYDTFAAPVGEQERRLRVLTGAPEIAGVVVYGREVPSANQLERWRTDGVRGFASKALSGDELAELLVELATGRVAPDETVLALPDGQPGEPHWPGRVDGLTLRESEVVLLAAEGLSNREIGDRLHLAAETVKSYLSDSYVKLGARNRIEAANRLRQLDGEQRSA